MTEIKTTRCPECNCDEYINKNLIGDGYRVCALCGQEWWVDVDYSNAKSGRGISQEMRLMQAEAEME